MHFPILVNRVRVRLKTQLEGLLLTGQFCFAVKMHLHHELDITFGIVIMVVTAGVLVVQAERKFLNFDP
jgi:hypothetical protein